MELLRLDVSADELQALPTQVADRPVVVRLRDGDVVVVMAACATSWPGEWGVWLNVDEGYSAALVARDVKTLSHLVELSHVVLEANDHGADHAAIVRALLRGEPVTMANAAGTLTQAYNLPAPPRAITVWYLEGSSLRDEHETLVEVSTSGATTTYASSPGCITI